MEKYFLYGIWFLYLTLATNPKMVDSIRSFLEQDTSVSDSTRIILEQSTRESDSTRSSLVQNTKKYSSGISSPEWRDNMYDSTRIIIREYIADSLWVGVDSLVADDGWLYYWVDLGMTLTDEFTEHIQHLPKYYYVHLVIDIQLYMAGKGRDRYYDDGGIAKWYKGRDIFHWWPERYLMYHQESGKLFVRIPGSPTRDSANYIDGKRVYDIEFLSEFAITIGLDDPWPDRK